MNGSLLELLAQTIAQVAHDGQCRRGNGEPYIEHVRRVADAQWGWRATSIAWLHDVLEDTDVSPDTLLELFPADLVKDVDVLTRYGHDQTQTYDEYITRVIEHGGDALLVKAADLADNLRDIDDMPTSFRRLKIRYQAANARVLEALEHPRAPIPSSDAPLLAALSLFPDDDYGAYPQ